MEIESPELKKLPSALLTAISFGIATEEEKEKLPVLTIEAVNEVVDPKLGLPNPSSQCSTCGSDDLKHCEGHFGVIKFPFTILHPYFMSEVVQILNKICPGCKSVRKDLYGKANAKSKGDAAKGCKYCKGKSTDWYPRMTFRASSQEVFRKAAIIAEIRERLSRKRGVPKKLADDYWDVIPKDEQLEENDLKPNKRVLSHSQVRHLLMDVDPDFIRKYISRMDLVFLDCFPVTPNSHRVSEFVHAFSNGQRLIFDERTRVYKKMVDFRGTANELSFRILECLKTSKLNADNSLVNDVIIGQQKKSNDFVSNASGSRYMKDVVLGKRNDHSFRMVVVGDPNLKLNEIGIPCSVAERLQILEHLTAWNWERLNTCCEMRLLERGQMHVRREGSLVLIRRTEELRLGDTIYRSLNDGDMVLVNRPPSIHQHSLIALSVKVIPVTSVLSINPLCCSPFRGDFDGDCLHGYVPQSVESRVELNELVALDKQLTNVQSGRNLLSFNQDSLVAAHLVMEDGVFFDIFQMQQLEMFCHHKKLLPAIVKAPSHGGSLWTGKQLISMLLPRGFDHESPSDDVYIRAGELVSSQGSFWLRDTDGNLFQSLMKQSQSQVLDFLYSAQEALCDWLSSRGLSVSLADLYLTPDSYSRKNMMDEILNALQDAEETSNFEHLMVRSYRDFLAGNYKDDQHGLAFDADNLCYEKQRSAALSQASIDAFKQVFRDIQSLFYKYASKDNSLLAMMKAGSKGNLLKLVQHSMCLGLQHSLVPLSFRMPYQLSCAGWNKLKADDAAKCAKSYIPYAVIEGSFLTGLNPVECFAHSVTNRESSFSDNADLPGTLTRRLMFFMRDIYAAYDGTVRNAYGNQIIQFSYGNLNASLAATDAEIVEKCDVIGGQPVGSLAACSISEAAYSALDQPISLLEKSPLLNLKNVLECGLKKNSSHQNMTLFLSEKLGRRMHGFEYGALEVQNQLEKLLFSDIVSFVKIIYSSQNQSGSKLHFSPWVIHFHISKETVKKKGLKSQPIIDSLYKQFHSAKTNIPNVQIAWKKCSVAETQREKEETCCLTVTAVESSKTSSIRLDTIQDMIPLLLETVIKGLREVDKVDILWKDRPKMVNLRRHNRGELYLRVSMSGHSDKISLWNKLMNSCIPIMDMIDWTRSHPDNIHELCLAYGVDAGRNLFLNHLASAVSDVGKAVLPQHMLLVANCLSVTGEFVGLNAKGLKLQREHASILSPFVQACFSTPGSSFIKAAKAGITDDLHGTIDALAWGKLPSIGTGQFDILYSSKGCELSEPLDVYNLLGTQMSSAKETTKIQVPAAFSYKCEKINDQFLQKFGVKKFENIRREIKRRYTYSDIHKLSLSLSRILNKYPVNLQLNDTDQAILEVALYFHPRRNEKVGTGFDYIKVINHPEYEDTRCFSLVKKDGTVEDFSYRKCVLGALEMICPQKAGRYYERYLQSLNISGVKGYNVQ